jgi:hypothetical protein
MGVAFASEGGTHVLSSVEMASQLTNRVPALRRAFACGLRGLRVSGDLHTKKGGAFALCLTWSSAGRAASRLLADENECQSGDDERREEERQEPLARASEGDDLAV